MATAQAARAAEDPAVARATEEREERDLQTAINDAQRETEQEVWEDALGDQPLDRDGDRSLEAMGDGLEGEVLEGDEAGETPPAAQDPADAETRERQGDVEIEDEEEPGQQQAGDREQAGAIPPARLREESDRRRTLEEENATLRPLRGQFDTLQRQFTELQQILLGRTQPQPRDQTAERQQPEIPDMYAQPKEYTDYVLKTATDAAVARMQAQTEQQRSDFVNNTLSRAAVGERGFEMTAAYNAMTALDPTNPEHRAVVAGIYYSQDPAAALFQWWDANDGPKFREYVLSQLTPAEQREQQRQDQDDGGAAPQRNSGRQSVQPRREFRPTPTTLPSLNSAAGSNSQRTAADINGFDGSDAAIFRFATAPD